MEETYTQSIPQDKFLTLSVNLLSRAFLEASRTDAKKLYRKLNEGARVALTRIEMEDKSQVRFDVRLDCSEFRGRLNYGSFRTSLTTLIANLVEVLRDKQKVKVFYAEHDRKVMIFGVTAPTVEDDVTNVMVLGADASDGQPAVMLQLMYLNPDQFISRAAADNR
ncbi:MAG: hypothetical protein ABR612_00475 [Chromatocurvus sp.]